jgi:hypothetical protein
MGGNNVNAEQPLGIGGNLGNHHQELEFSLLIGETRQVPLVANRPVHVVYSLSRVFDADTGAPEEPAIGTWDYFYDSARNLGPEDTGSESLRTGCNAYAKVRIENGLLLVETLNGDGPSCKGDIPAELHVSLWY